ncbi:MAG: hypothetical protein F6K31_25300, partial [Symploca sp. SIO2G7]|nr:hypothetical protein [Symploca sp. SIO2G7]
LQQPTVNNQQSTANSQQSTANSQQPTVNSQLSSPSGEKIFSSRLPSAFRALVPYFPCLK